VAQEPAHADLSPLWNINKGSYLHQEDRWQVERFLQLPFGAAWIMEKVQGSHANRGADGRKKLPGNVTWIKHDVNGFCDRWLSMSALPMQGALSQCPASHNRPNNGIAAQWRDDDASAATISAILAAA